MIVIQTDHFVNKTVTECFAHGIKAEKVNIKDYKFNVVDTIASYGIKRGIGDLMKQSRNFFYMDHGYLSASDRNFIAGHTNINAFDGYFRIVKNDFISIRPGQFKDDRLKNLKINFEELRTKGEYIILSEPSENIKNFFNLHNWIEETIKELKKYSDRKIIVHNKHSEISLDDLLKNAWAFVSCQSTAGFKAMIKGVPAHFTYDTLKEINPISNIENSIINYEIFKNISYSQWTLREMFEGKIYNYIHDTLSQRAD